ncbi:MBL fold metallo-hydrolase [Patescibacteria group bacterium]|nr:MBL fold metallo-hydrolase [Patescibacteria group bacterium]MCL5091633.1 MBL fold metallo-hydrolase [Patescibacteria group bacterium]
MKIVTLALGELAANCYLLIEDKDCLLIDPADAADYILETLQRDRLQLRAMLATHGHFDHLMAAGEIQLSYPNIPLFIDQKDRFLVDRLIPTARHFLHQPRLTVVPARCQFFSGRRLTMSPFKLKIIPVPGHTPGSVAFYFPESKAVFCGDTVFKAAIGRTDFSYGDRSALLASIKHLIDCLPADTVIYPGHGEATSVGAQRERLL